MFRGGVPGGGGGGGLGLRHGLDRFQVTARRDLLQRQYVSVQLWVIPGKPDVSQMRSPIGSWKTTGAAENALCLWKGFLSIGALSKIDAHCIRDLYYIYHHIRKPRVNEAAFSDLINFHTTYHIPRIKLPKNDILVNPVGLPPSPASTCRINLSQRHHLPPEDSRRYRTRGLARS